MTTTTTNTNNNNPFKFLNDHREGLLGTYQGYCEDLFEGSEEYEEILDCIDMAICHYRPSLEEIQIMKCYGNIIVWRCAYKLLFKECDVTSLFEETEQYAYDFSVSSLSIEQKEFQADLFKKVYFNMKKSMEAYKASVKTSRQAQLALAKATRQAELTLAKATKQEAQAKLNEERQVRFKLQASLKEALPQLTNLYTELNNCVEEEVEMFLLKIRYQQRLVNELTSLIK
jgi:hypothetical protein